MRYYTKEQIINWCEEASKEMKSFYNVGMLNYSGETRKKELYTEIIAEWLLNNIEKLSEIKLHIRESSYNRHHKGTLGKGKEDSEKNIAIKIFNQGTFSDGLIIKDYQIPLKNRLKDKEGEIDLLAINEQEKSVYIFELKKKDCKRPESMLRCVLEGYTYLRTVCKEKLFFDFNIPQSYELKAAPLVFEGEKQYDEYMDKDRIYLHKLMKKLNIIPFFLSKNKKAEFVITKATN